MTLLVTGGAGFIGSNFILNWLAGHDETIVNLDKLTYAGNPRNLDTLKDDLRYVFVNGDIGDEASLRKLLTHYRPRAILNFAAESHVDRSIDGPAAFIETNVMGTFHLLQAARGYYHSLPEAEQILFRFLQVSTDEVYGSLVPDEPAFTEENAFRPNSPYSASKASSDHLVRAYHHTYGLPTLTTNCSNNYGPYQFPEKLIPLMISNALAGKPLPVYGDGRNIRDWLYVVDHCRAIECVLEAGTPGETYNVGGRSEIANIDVVHTLCAILNARRPLKGGGNYRDLIAFVKDRPGHDRRYAIDDGKIRRELGWSPQENFESGIVRTVDWYLDNTDWVANIVSRAHQHTAE